MLYNRSGPADETSSPDGDAGFIGVEMRQHPSQLAPGYVPDAFNLRFNNGVPETRKGTVKLAWTNKIVGAGIQPWGMVHGRGSFKDTDEREWLITAADGNVYASLANNVTTALALPAGVSITGPVSFEQGSGTLVMMRGFDDDPLVMDDIRVGFTAAPPATAPATSSMPRGVKAIWVGDRLFIMAANDEVWASDLLDLFTYSEPNKFRINQGSVDPLVTIALFGKSDIICAKRSSIFRLTNVVGDLANSEVLPITRRFGCRAAGGVIDTGLDLLIYSDDGVARITLTQFGELQADKGELEQHPWFSDPIQPLMERIHPAYAPNVVFALWNRHLYMAVPMDAAESVRQELVYLERFPASGHMVVPVTAGASYRFSMDAASSGLDNGTANYTNSTDFIAQGSTITLHGPAHGTSFSSLKLVYKGVNNAIFVYNFQNQAWSGYDQADGLDAKDLFLATFANRQRLFTVGTDGWITLYEEGWNDQLSQPYADLFVTSIPQVGDALQVNGGTVIHAVASNVNAGSNWGALSIAAAGFNLNGDSGDRGGYAAQTTSPWTAPGAINQVLENAAGIFGIRFIATNGVLPVFGTFGSWFSITYHTVQEIVSRITTRGYVLGKPLAFKRSTELDCQIQTWNPTLTFSIVGEGQAREQIALGPITRDRTKFTDPFNAPRYNVANPLDNCAAPHREDYSFTFATVTSTVDPRANGLRLDIEQESTVQLRPVPDANRSPQVRVLCTTGRFRLIAAGLEGFETQRRQGFAA